ncbi:MAG: Phosphoenolpyruvate carboxykinase [GTP], partial [Chlamydiae bacterium]|nr:Phosphoenolpyruvate carboxykinase [GTP] [Chlamydiota bacterium]
MLENLKNLKLRNWIEEIVELCQPNRVYLCNGSEAEYQELAAELVKNKTFIPLNEQLRPNSFLARSDPKD